MHILFVFDNNKDFEILLSKLEANGLEFSFTRVDQLAEINKALHSKSFDIVVSDVRLENLTGIEVLNTFNSYNLNIPFITIAGSDVDEMALSMLSEGSDDYVLKNSYDRLYLSIQALSKKYSALGTVKPTDRSSVDSENTYRLLVENSKDIIIRLTLSGEFIFTSSAILEVTGYDSKEIIGSNIRDFIHPEDIHKIKTHIFSTSDNQQFECRFRTKSGDYIWVESFVKFVYDELTNTAKEIIAITRDVSERILRENQLKVSEEQYRLIAENVTDMITRHDVHGNYDYVSASSYALLGYTPDDLKSHSAFEFLHPEDVENIQSGLKELYSKGQGIYTASYRYKRKDGRYIWIESTNKLTYSDSDAKIDGVISISRDISERKNFELKLEEKIKELDTFIYRSSHDLKGPLASLQGLINVAKSEIKDSTSIQYFGLIERSVNHLDTLLMDLLNITRIAQGSLNLVNLNLAELIDSTIKSFDHLPEYDRILWEIDVDPSISVQLDKSLINNVIHNLIINSIKYYDKNKDQSQIKITLKEKNEMIVLNIEDNGEGIPEDIQTHVFDMFFRGNTKSSGTGLGLYIVKNAIEKLGGQIKMQSKLDMGTKFSIQLPMIKSTEQVSVDYLNLN